LRNLNVQHSTIYSILKEPPGVIGGTSGFRGTQVEKHWRKESFCYENAPSSSAMLAMGEKEERKGPFHFPPPPFPFLSKVANFHSFCTLLQTFCFYLNPFL